MGKNHSKSSRDIANPSLLRKTFTNTFGEVDSDNLYEKLELNIKEISVYRIPFKLISHIVNSKRYFMLIEIQSCETSEYFSCFFTEDGTKHLKFFSSKNQAIFSPLRDDFSNATAEKVRSQEINGKKVQDLFDIFYKWNKPYNLILRNSKHFVKYMEKQLKSLKT